MKRIVTTSAIAGAMLLGRVQLCQGASPDSGQAQSV
jgi:hypothetical protein